MLCCDCALNTVDFDIDIFAIKSPSIDIEGLTTVGITGAGAERLYFGVRPDGPAVVTGKVAGLC